MAKTKDSAARVVRDFRAACIPDVIRYGDYERKGWTIMSKDIELLLVRINKLTRRKKGAK